MLQVRASQAADVQEYAGRSKRDHETTEETHRLPGYLEYAGIDALLESTTAIVSGVVNRDIITPPHGISNISEWCKRDSCWRQIQARTGDIENRIPRDFYDRLVSYDDQALEERTAKQTQRIDDGIEAQRRVVAIPAAEWAHIHQLLLDKELLTPKEAGVLKIAMQIPGKLPNDKQSIILLDVLDKARMEGIVKDEP